MYDFFWGLGLLGLLVIILEAIIGENIIDNVSNLEKKIKVILPSAIIDSVDEYSETIVFKWNNYKFRITLELNCYSLNDWDDEMGNLVVATFENYRLKYLGGYTVSIPFELKLLFLRVRNYILDKFFKLLNFLSLKKSKNKQ